MKRESKGAIQYKAIDTREAGMMTHKNQKPIKRGTRVLIYVSSESGDSKTQVKEKHYQNKTGNTN